jgi:hypothetical protein
MVRIGIAMLFLCLLLSVDIVAAGQEAGTVMNVTPGAFVERDGKKLPLTGKSAVFSGDILSTDATGRVRIWMRDETTLSLGSDTEFEIEEYEEIGNRPAFTAKMTGLARMLTGRIAKANPEGFKVTTPQAVVGIRGTILTVRASSSRTIVYVENTLRRVVVNGVSVPSGSKALVPRAGAVPQVSPFTPEDRRILGAELAVRRIPGDSTPAEQYLRVASATAGNVSPDGEGARITAGAMVGGRDGMAAKAVAANIRRNQNGQGLNVTPQNVTPPMPAPDPISPITPIIDPVMPQWPATLPETVYVSGSLQDSTLFGPAMSINEFSFTANLKTGAVRDAALQGGIMDGGDYNLRGGSGAITPKRFDIQNLTGTYVHYVPNSTDGWAQDTVTGAMTGSVKAGASDLSVTGKYSVKDATGRTLDSGKLSGSSRAH